MGYRDKSLYVGTSPLAAAGSPMPQRHPPERIGRLRGRESDIPSSSDGLNPVSQHSLVVTE